MRVLPAVVVVLIAVLEPSASGRKQVVAHRGASGYAPEHTRASYRLGLEQGADYIEQDVAVTKDGVLICLHDPTLERTTNVEEVFPERASVVAWEGKSVRGWLANDFTLAEIKRLDAGSWFDAKFAGEKIPTFQEAIDLVKGKAGLYPELKLPELYASRNVDVVKMLVDALARNGLSGPNADPKTPVVIQTFNPDTVRRLASMRLGLPLVLLLYDAGSDSWGSLESLVAVKAAGATGVGPAKTILQKHPQFVSWAHALGLTVTPYTFRARSPGTFASVRDEMAYFLDTLDVDAVFTDNPDQFPKR
jgi:glycerophosphoryl diester phosphodiesterase